MKAFIVAMILLVALAAVAAVSMDALPTSSQEVYSTENVRH